MKEDKVYQQLVSKMGEVSEVEPQTLGPLTLPYKWLVPYLKVHPWIPLFSLAFFFSLLIYLFFGGYIVYFTSILQYGF